MVLVKPTTKQTNEEITYKELNCGTISGGDNVCKIPLNNGKLQPTILKISNVKSTTFIKSSLGEAKIDLSAFKSVGQISGIYTVGYSGGVETLLYVKHAGGTHTIHIEGHKSLTKDLFLDNDSKDLIDGLVTNKAGADYYNLLCGMQQAENKCLPVTIEGKEMPTGYLLNPSVSARTVVHNSKSESFFFNLQNLEKKDSINQDDKIDPRFDHKIEFYHNDKIVHTVVITNPNDFVMGLVNSDDTYVY